MTKKILVLALLGFSKLFGQSEADFDKFGKKLFTEITDTNYKEVVEYIRTREYHELIDEQPISDNQKSILKHKINEDYNNMYLDYQNSIRDLAQNYYDEMLDGSTFEYLDTHHEAMDNTKDFYRMITTFIYRNGKMQTVVSFKYEAAWVSQDFVLVSGVKEDF